MTITKTKQVDRNGNVSHRIAQDGLHLGDVHKVGSSTYRPELPNGDYGPTGSIKDGVLWLTRFAKPTPDAIREQIQLVTHRLEVAIPAAIHEATYLKPHARRLASLRNQRTEAEQTLSRLVTRLGGAIQEQGR